ncbi:rhomboid family intramembrane serine protease [Flavobacteriaceae bacterium]|nr:rhomboid family intramembrane serine protease [Flavobacteriaceae bacterium]
MLFIIIIITCIFSIKGFKDLIFFNKYKFHIQSIKKGEKYRMWSSAFLHADYSHLFFNLFTLWVFSGAILMQLGEFYYVIIYSLSLYFGNFFTLKQHKNEVLYSAVGASGAVTGIVYSSILLFPEMKLALLFFPVPLPSYVFGLCYILYSIYGMKKNTGNIGHSAHLGGAIAGMIITILIKPSILIDQTWLVLLLLTPFLILYYDKKNSLFR